MNGITAVYIYHVDDLLQDQAECDGERLRLVGDRSLQSVVVARVSQQIVQQSLLVSAAAAFCSSFIRLYRTILGETQIG